MAAHPDLQTEQAYIEYAYECLEEARAAALRLRTLTATGPGGTHQNRFERESIEDVIRARLSQLEIGDEALCFGRIDRLNGDDARDNGDGNGDEPHSSHASAEPFYIGRIAVASRSQEPVVVDWRAPIAEPFYRATGKSPMGLARRRHFATRGRVLLDIEDEIFGDGATGDGELVGRGALIAALERSRTGHLGDIVATIQAEQDEIIRSELGGVLVVQGGPGTGKTVVALHRAAYLLYTHRFPLEGQGVLVVGPNRVFLRYIERVLPSLGEAGVELAMLADLVPEPIGDEREAQATARVKGDVRMAHVLVKAARDRELPLREELAVPFGRTTLRLTVEASERIVKSARRRARTHNAGRKVVEQMVWETLALSARGGDVDPEAVRETVRGQPEVRAALEWMWPVLTPAEFLRDLFGSRALLRHASERLLSEEEQGALYRDRGETLEDVRWTAADVPLLDEARELLGPRPRRRDQDEIRTHGHIIVDEVQDLSPMELRMLERRSLSGSMTVVGDIAQATGATAAESWDEMLSHLPNRKPARVSELTIGYRIPRQVMEYAARLLADAAPQLRAPRSVREGELPPTLVRTTAGERGAVTAQTVLRERAAVGDGSVAIVCADSVIPEIADGLQEAGIEFGMADRTGLDSQVTIVPVRLAKGLELDAVVVVEPALIVREEPQGIRALYVALTRPTKRLTVVHAEELPDSLR